MRHKLLVKRAAEKIKNRTLQCAQFMDKLQQQQKIYAELDVAGYEPGSQQQACGRLVHMESVRQNVKEK